MLIFAFMLYAELSDHEPCFHHDYLKKHTKTGGQHTCEINVIGFKVAKVKLGKLTVHCRRWAMLANG